MSIATDRHLTKIFERSKLAVDVTFGVTSTRGFWDDEQLAQQDEAGMERELDVRMLTLRRVDADLLDVYATVTIDGTAYQARKKLRAEDGSVVRVLVAEITG